MVCRHKGTHDVRVLLQSIHEALDAYLAAHPTVSPVRDTRAVAVDLPRTVWSQDRVLSHEENRP